MNPKTDGELVRAIQEGDIPAFEELVKRYQRGLFAFVHRILENEDDAYEVVQDTFFQIYKTIERVDPERKFSTYAFEIAKNTSISVLRKRKRTVSLEMAEDIEDDESLLERVSRADDSVFIRRKIEQLPEKYKSVITLYYFDDVSYEEISQTLGLPVNTVRTHLKRAKSILKKELSHES